MGWTVSFHRCSALINLRQHFTTICMDVYGATFGLLYCILFLCNIQIITGTVHENANCTKQNEIKWFHFSPSERKHNYFNHQSRWHYPLECIKSNYGQPYFENRGLLQCYLLLFCNITSRGLMSILQCVIQSLLNNKDTVVLTANLTDTRKELKNRATTFQCVPRGTL